MTWKSTGPTLKAQTMTTTERRIYIAGRMTGLPGHNFALFHGVARELKRQGWQVVNPANHFAGDVTRPRHEYMAASLHDLLTIYDWWQESPETRTAAIAMLPGWAESQGARLEHQQAVAFGFDVHDATRLLDFRALAWR